MKTQTHFFAGIGLIAIATACSSFAQDKTIELTLRDLDGQWSQAAGAKNVDKVVSYYSNDAIVLPPNAPAITSKEAIRKFWQDDIANSVRGSWKATRVEVAKSGDMAYVSGTYDWTEKGENGKEINDHGKYLEVWEKQPDGSWKCGADMFSSDLPAASQ